MITNLLTSPAPYELLIGDSKLAPFHLDVAKEAGAVVVVAGSGLDLWQVQAPECVESPHHHFAKVFAQHGCDRHRHASSFGFLAEDDPDAMPVLAEPVFAVAVGFAVDLE